MENIFKSIGGCSALTGVAEADRIVIDKSQFLGQPPTVHIGSMPSSSYAGIVHQGCVTARTLLVHIGKPIRK